ncbi:MAG: hypothetical protein RB288_00220 [Bacteroidales bacterium]|jgi:glycine cleavage system H lipoate-binding protein|nr:hypothetical protein [Bacteroidales bacterium]
MKRIIPLTICLIMLHFGIMAGQKSKSEPAQNPVNLVSVATSPETETLTKMWVEGFRAKYPDAEVTVLPSEEFAGADIMFITGNSSGNAEKTAAWKIVVGRDVIVPVMSATNPFLSGITASGISPGRFVGILTAEGTPTWGELLNNENPSPVNILIPDDIAVVSALSRFTQTDPALVGATTSLSSADIPAALNSNPQSIAFCRLADITDPTGQGFVDGIQIIPVDVNNNARSDYFEQFYADYNSFSRGVYIGKYPKALCNNIYAASAANPAPGAPSDLIKYVLVDGQPILAGTGFTALARGEGMNRRDALVTDQAMVMAGRDSRPIFRAWLWILAVIVTVTSAAYAIYRLTRSGAEEIVSPMQKPSVAFSLKSLITPAGILFDKGHTWAFMEKDGLVRIGIDDFLQHLTGSVTRLRMKDPGEKVRKGEHVVSVIQNGKQLDLKSPVSGRIVMRNERLAADAGIMNSSPYDEGWIYAIEADNWEKESRLMVIAGKYIDYLKEEFARIRDFLSVMPGTGDLRYAHVVLQDGGEFKDGLLEEFGPEVWEEFQVKFLR